MTMEQMSFLEEKGDADTVSFSPTREAGLERLNTFAPYCAGAYASKRNFDFGSEQRSNISCLSPWVRHRLISEEEILSETLKQHSLRSAEKFIQEVFWRAYFKGWLEQRPDVWFWYKKDLKSALRQIEKDGALRQRYEEAINGKTGIEAFDAWANELVATGYLHNHSRMWFASIWIFTLKLPWELGADFFYRHLMDGDPASNTCSWRWVAGLHTKGKNYSARASNISKFTNGRFSGHMNLASDPMPLSEDREARLVPPPVNVPFEASNFALLVTEEDCLPETLPLTQKPSQVIAMLATQKRSPLEVGAAANAFAQGALKSTLQRLEKTFECSATMLEGEELGAALLDHARQNNLQTIATAHAPIGPVASELRKAKAFLADHDIHLHQILRPYDALSWPHATKGFFKMKKQIPRLVEKLGVA